MAKPKTCEELYIQNAENGIRALRGGRKTIAEANVPLYLTKLKGVNVGMYEDLKEKYDNVLKSIQNK